MRNNWLILEIAAGILLANFVMASIERYQAQQAIAALNEQLQQRQTKIETQPEPAPAQKINYAPVTIPDGYRCIDGQLVKELPHGFSGSDARTSAYYCGNH